MELARTLRHRCFTIPALLCGLCASAHPLDTWHVRHTGPAVLWGVTFGSDLFVAVGSSGTILTSATGSNWSPQSAGTSASLNGIAYGKRTFVGVGDNGAILSSPNGSNWVTRAAGVTNRLLSVAFENGLFLAAGEFGALLTSTDGSSWSTQEAGSLFYAWFIAHGNGMFLLESTSGTNLVSMDGTNWFKRPSGSDTALYTAGFGRGQFVAIDIHRRSFISSDGSNWVAGESVALLRPNQITYGNGHFVASANGSVGYSQNGLNWTVSPTGYLTWDVAFGNGTFVAVGERETIKQSDPVVWLQSFGPGSLDIYGPPAAEYIIEGRVSPGPADAWSTLTNLTPANLPHRWTDPERSQHANRFYRVSIQQ